MTSYFTNRRIFFSVALLLSVPMTSSITAQSKDGTGDSHSIGMDYYHEIDDENPEGTIVVNGHSVEVAMDTGSGGLLVLTQSAADALNLDTEPHESGRFTTAMVRLGSDHERNQNPPLKIFCVPAPPIFGCDGVIGWPFLKQFVWLIFYPERRQSMFEVLPDSVRDNWQSFPIIESDHGNLVIEIGTEDGPVKVLLDTGSNDGVMLNPERWEQWSNDHPESWRTLHAGYSPASRQGFHIMPVAVTDQFQLGDLSLGKVTICQTFAEVTVDGQDADLEFHLGLGAIRNRPILIDGPGGRVYFGPATKPFDDLPFINRAQATFIPASLQSDECFARVIKDGAAYRAGLRDGDKILRVNGRDAANWREDMEVRPSAVFKNEAGSVVNLVIERDGENIEISITLESTPLDP